MSGDIAPTLRNDWAEQGTPHSPLVSLNASTVVAVTEMGPVGVPRHREGSRLCPVTQRQAGVQERATSPSRTARPLVPLRCFTGQGAEEDVLGVRAEPPWAPSTGRFSTLPV